MNIDKKKLHKRYIFDFIIGFLAIIGTHQAFKELDVVTATIVSFIIYYFLSIVAIIFWSEGKARWIRKYTYIAPIVGVAIGITMRALLPSVEPLFDNLVSLESLLLVLMTMLAISLPLILLGVLVGSFFSLVIRGVSKSKSHDKKTQRTNLWLIISFASLSALKAILFLDHAVDSGLVKFGDFLDIFSITFLIVLAVYKLITLGMKDNYDKNKITMIKASIVAFIVFLLI